MRFLPIALVIISAAAISLMPASRNDSQTTLDSGPKVSAPANVRIKVQVLNGSKTAGLAARAVKYLRDRGFDVVESGNSAKPSDSTVVLDRSGRMDWARLVALSLAVPHVRSEPDTSFFVDVTVVLGADWVPPSRTFNP